METLEQRVGKLELAVEENTKITQKVSGDTEELIEFFRGAKTAIKFFVIFGTIIRKIIIWTGGIVAAIGSLWLFWEALKIGKPPNQ